MTKILVYSLPSLPLAALYFSLYVLLGNFYFNEFSLSLSAIGVSFILVRLFDAFSDPVMGYVSDNFYTRFGRRKPWVFLGGCIFVYAAWMLLVPDPDAEIGMFYFACWLLISTIGWTIMYSPYYALGAELSSDYSERSKITFCRELLVLLGIVLASLLYSISFELNTDLFIFDIRPSVGLKQICLTSGVLFLLSMIFFLLSRGFGRDIHDHKNQKFEIQEIIEVLRSQRLFSRLLISQFLNGLANGFPPALFVFFVNYLLQLPALVGPLLILYFVGAIIGVPFWLLLSQKYDKHRLWCAAMIYACIVFFFVILLNRGDLVGFSIICFLTGLALSADLALPTSIQADVLDLEVLRTGKRPSGQFFAIWGFVSKSAVAVSTGLALILLDLVGFQPNIYNGAFALTFLSFMYGGIPIILKCLSVYLMWNFELDRKRHQEIMNSLKSKEAI